MNIATLDLWSEPLAHAAEPFLGGGPEILVALKPLVDLSQGDITTDLAIRLAARCKIHSEKVAQSIIDALPKEYPGRCEQVRGYINIVVDSDRLLVAPLDKSPLLAPANVLFCPKQSSDVFAATRLFGIAALQTLIRRALGAETKLFSASGPVPLTTDSFISIAQTLATLAPSPKEFFSDIGPEAMRNASDRHLFFWLASDYASGAQVGRFLREYFAGKESLTLLSVPKELLIKRGELLEDLPIETIDRKRLVALLFSFACNVSGDEFDFDTSRLKEKGNIIWYLESLAARLDSLIPPATGKNSEPPSSFDGLESPYRLLYLRSLMLPWFLIDSANGRVLEFITVLDDLLSRLSRLINTPQFRAVVARDELSWPQRYILSGAAHTLSGIIRLVSGCCESLE